MSSIQRETVDEVLPDIQPLLREHYAEIAHFQDIPLAPDFDKYRALERAGTLRIMTARDGQRLLGYQVMFVGPNMHYSTSKQAQQDLLFIRPELRGSTLGPRLIGRCDHDLREEGVQVVYQRTKAKAGLNFGPLLLHMGYDLIDHVYARRLDHGRDRRSGG